MTRKPLRSKPHTRRQPGPIDLVGSDLPATKRQPPDATRDPEPPLDEMDVPPLTDPDETKGG